MILKGKIIPLLPTPKSSSPNKSAASTLFSREFKIFETQIFTSFRGVATFYLFQDNSSYLEGEDY